MPIAHCPFALWHPIGSDAGPFKGGPYKIVHHTTEGSTVAGALAALKNLSPHFVVGPQNIYQLVELDRAGKSLRNSPGGVETNKDSAIQIEMVGRAGYPKNHDTMINMRVLLRWLEKTLGIPKVWPNGYPNPPTANHQDPGHHNRNAHNWDTMGGHYGHSQVPENIHWDPAYTKAEVEFLMSDVEEVEHALPPVA